ncbi:MAG: hypothetical protein JNM57_00140 [Cyclobacteriaceae bacterium]|nr:hypothetical protein [Cyclobacteriaceae bacterium]
MSPFEYTMVLISIILGLGITTILTGLAEHIRHSGLFKIYTPHLIWIALVFVLHVQEWWENYSLMSIAAWKLPLFLFILLYPINLYILAHLLFPSSRQAETDSKTYYLENYPKLFISAIILGILSIIHNLTISNWKISDQFPQAILLILLTGFLLSKTKNEKIHTIMSFILLVMMLMVLFFTRELYTLSA